MVKQDMKPDRIERGFTLIEVILAVSILAFVVSISYSSINQIIAGKQLVEDRSELQRVANGIMLRLTRELQRSQTQNKRQFPIGAGAAAPTGPASAGPNRVMEGVEEQIDGRAADSIEFLAADSGQYLPDASSNTGDVRIAYRVEKTPAEELKEQRLGGYGDEGPELFYLVRDEVPVQTPYASAIEKRMTFPIAKNVLSLKFRYYDKQKEEWVNKWNGTGRPKIISIALQLRSKRGKVESYVTQVFIEQ